MALHCTSFLAMYVPSKYGGGVVCVFVGWRGVCVWWGRWGVRWGRRKRDGEKEGAVTCFCWPVVNSRRWLWRGNSCSEVSNDEGMGGGSSPSLPLSLTLLFCCWGCRGWALSATYCRHYLLHWLKTGEGRELEKVETPKRVFGIRYSLPSTACMRARVSSLTGHCLAWGGGCMMGRVI